MSNHKTHIAGVDPHCQVKCTCRVQSPIMSRLDATEWEWKHHKDVQRARAGLRPQPSLRNQRDWFLAMSENPLVPKEERDMWLALAEELNHRVATGEVDEDQMELW